MSNEDDPAAEARQDEDVLRPPATVTPELFAEWRAPRFGAANPEELSNPWWNWLIETRLNAYQANKLLDGPSPFDAGPSWCFDRLGQSRTDLPDGTTVFIGGEHEDDYDPDFCIYNDVTILGPDTPPRILGYPREVFPPTDFHSATLAGNRIIVIGALALEENQRIGETQVFELDCEDWSMHRVASTGDCPGWIHKHQAALTDDGRAIIVRDGMVERGPGRSCTENIDEWRLDLETMQWTRLTDRCWPRFSLQRKDGRPLGLLEARIAATASEFLRHPESLPEAEREFLEMRINRCEKRYGRLPPLDRVSKLYRPSLAHKPLPDEEDDPGCHRIRIGNVTVRYLEDYLCVRLRVEGELDAESVELLKTELRDHLEAIEGVEFIIESDATD